MNVLVRILSGILILLGIWSVLVSLVLTLLNRKTKFFHNILSAFVAEIIERYLIEERDRFSRTRPAKAYYQRYGQ